MSLGGLPTAPVAKDGLVPACMMLYAHLLRVKRARPISSRVFAQGLLRAPPLQSRFERCLLVFGLVLLLFFLGVDKRGELAGLSCT
jgi:hypothetical protein